MKNNPFITRILDENEVENQIITLEETQRVFKATYLGPFFDDFLVELEKYEPKYRTKPGILLFLFFKCLNSLLIQNLNLSFRIFHKISL